VNMVETIRWSRSLRSSENMPTGHDDTLWMIDNVLKLLEGLDPSQPQVITDNIWFSPQGVGEPLPSMTHADEGLGF